MSTYNMCVCGGGGAYMCNTKYRTFYKKLALLNIQHPLLNDRKIIVSNFR